MDKIRSVLLEAFADAVPDCLGSGGAVVLAREFSWECRRDPDKSLQ